MSKMAKARLWIDNNTVSLLIIMYLVTKSIFRSPPFAIVTAITKDKLSNIALSKYTMLIKLCETAD